MITVTRRTCIVSDGIMSFTLAAAQELGVPQVQLWTASACGFLGYLHYTTLIEKGYTPLKGICELLDKWIPRDNFGWHTRYERCTFKGSSSFLSTTNPDDFMIKFVQLQETERARKASAIVINTFETLESEVLVGFSKV
ncbi:hypothetical protein KY290_010041 [Solanum tuberosum]|uniref:Uncharacterized protein n=1 Tax=Solanum tuberosum TaxID=4113 RepID=A0ABQ7VYS9_SOLTU|nr:hypothetical protein KY289_010421 [Solanum tuberosum]KAH0708568.1 hypothetical protein KY284_009995 [Solanum tuberosum]KAH0772904.1 hypothetical protein KY290_010041 [Solanum tuberosum]